MKLLTNTFLKWWSKPDRLFMFAAFWALVQFCLLVAEHLQWDRIYVPIEMPFFYTTLIMLYVLRKRAEAWLDTARKKRKGEYFLIGWYAALLGMLINQIFSHGQYTVPKRMYETCLLILIPFCTGELLKMCQKHQLRQNQTGMHDPAERREAAKPH